jgi:hypothetical protein
MEREVFEQSWQVKINQLCAFLFANLLPHSFPDQEMGLQEDG